MSLKTCTLCRGVQEIELWGQLLAQKRGVWRHGGDDGGIVSESCSNHTVAQQSLAGIF